MTLSSRLASAFHCLPKRTLVQQDRFLLEICMPLLSGIIGGPTLAFGIAILLGKRGAELQPYEVPRQTLNPKTLNPK